MKQGPALNYIPGFTREEDEEKQWQKWYNPFSRISNQNNFSPLPQVNSIPTTCFPKVTFSIQLTIYFLIVLGSVVALGPAAVNLRTAANYAILAESGISTLPPSVITGSVAVSPIAVNGLTGFSLTLDSTGQFSTSAEITGKLFAASYPAPIPSTLTAAIGDMGTAFTDAAGLYKWTRAVSIGSNVTISGGVTDSEAAQEGTETWIFQVSGVLSVTPGTKVVLVGGAITAATSAHLKGIVLGKTSITLLTGATANSRLLSRSKRGWVKVRFTSAKANIPLS
ncbi:hypothetical protein C8R45DRAFT_948125 [Mycena sanguinolenta]|nr:hypothetical protein C8R45DRAFT_948125 [Mycena sanguinolenta]